MREENWQKIPDFHRYENENKTQITSTQCSAESVDLEISEVIKSISMSDYFTSNTVACYNCATSFACMP